MKSTKGSPTQINIISNKTNNTEACEDLGPTKKRIITHDRVTGLNQIVQVTTQQTDELDSLWNDVVKC